MSRNYCLPIVLFALSLVAVGVSHNLTDEELLAYKPPDDIIKNFPYYLCGYDEEGAPVWVWEMGKWDLRSYVEAGGEKYESFLISGDQMFLRFAKSGQENGTGFVNILDMDKFNLRQVSHAPTVQYMLKQFRTFSNMISHGDMKQGYIINTNALFQTVLDLAKPLLGSLAEKVQIYGTNPDSWKPVLLRAIPKSQLPEFYGGSKDFKPVKVYG